MKIRLLDYIGTVKKNSRTTKQLKNFNVLSKGRITKEMARSQKDGEVICSICESKYLGLFKPAEISEVKHFHKTIDSRITEMKKVAPASEDLLKSPPADLQALQEVGD